MEYDCVMEFRLSRILFGKFGIQEIVVPEIESTEFRTVTTETSTHVRVVIYIPIAVYCNKEGIGCMHLILQSRDQTKTKLGGQWPTLESQ